MSHGYPSSVRRILTIMSQEDMDGYVTTIITSRLSTVTASSSEYIIDQALDVFWMS